MKTVLCLPKFKAVHAVGYVATNGEIGSSLITRK